MQPNIWQCWAVKVAATKTKTLAVVLAGGQSSRMGQNKAAMFSSKLQNSLLGHCTQLLAQLTDVNVLVSGENEVGGIADILPQRGPLSGIHAVLAHIDLFTPITGFLFVPVDMPNLTITTLNNLLEFGRTNGCAAYPNNCFLPCYLPNTPHLRQAVEQQMIHTQNWSIKALLQQLNGQSFFVDNRAELVNVNEPKAFSLHCQ